MTTTYGQPRRQRPRFYGIVVAAVIVVLVFGIGAVALGGAGSEEGFGDGAAAEQADESQGQAPAFEGMPGVDYPDQESLAWRDEDFAVDPSRQDWNFEKSERKVMYLTFDDGPSKNTQRVLDILDQYGCKATFFVIGHDVDYFPMIAEAYHRGHTIGLHSMTHEYSDVYASTDAYFEDLEEIGEVVKEQIGYVPCFVRFPGGSSNTVSRNYEDGIMTQLSQMVPERGYQYYDWNLACGDGATVTTEEIYAETLIEPESSNIMLLCHDAGAKDTTVEALLAIIEHFQARGYSFEAIDRSSWVSHHTVNN